MSGWFIIDQEVSDLGSAEKLTEAMEVSELGVLVRTTVRYLSTGKQVWSVSTAIVFVPEAFFAKGEDGSIYLKGSR